MDWNSLLDDLWNYGASDPKELEAKIRSCLKGHSTESFLGEISRHIAQGQHDTARQSLTDFLALHPSAESIRRRLELILLFKKHHLPQPISIKSKQRSKELLIQEVNVLVAASKLQAAEALLLEAIETIEDPDYLNLLGRVYRLQRKPIAAAEALQKGLQLQRQQQAFIETPHEESELPTDDDLAFLNSTAENLSSFDTASSPEVKALGDSVDESLSYIQQTASIYPSLDSGTWWDKAKTASNPSVPGEETEPGEATTLPERINGSTDNTTADNQASQSVTDRPILKLNRTRKDKAPQEDDTVRVSSKAGRTFSIPASAEPEKLEPVTNVNKKTISPAHPAASAISAPAFRADDDQESEQLAETFVSITWPEPIIPEVIKAEEEQGLGEDEPADEYDIYLQDGLSDFDTGDYQATQPHLDDLDDEFAAYAFDPDEVFDNDTGDTAEPDDGLPDRITREERALQKAAELVLLVGWPRSTVPLIQQIFIMSGWGATRLALEREIDKGITPEELILAAHIKAIWAENDIYWIAFNRSGSSQLSHQALSWPNALQIVRSFDSLPQVEEIEFFLEEIFTSWYENPTLRRAFKAFARYLWFRFSDLDGCLPANQPFDFCSPQDLPLEEYSDLGLYDVLDIEETAALRYYGVFQTKHPLDSSCYFSDLPIMREEEYEARAALIAKLEKKHEIQKAIESKTSDEVDQESIDISKDDAYEYLPQWSPNPLEPALHPKPSRPSN